MALNRKYAALPDLDDAPDTYATPELTDDNSTVPTGTARSQSAQSNYDEFDDAPGSPSISRTRLRTDDARRVFEPAVVDAKDVDFSDRVNGKKKSYKVSSRRRGEYSDEDEEDGDGSEEALERKMVRLRREVEELKASMAKQREEKLVTRAPEKGQSKLSEVEEMSRVLQTMEVGDAGQHTNSASRLTKALATSIDPQTPSTSAAETQNGRELPSMTYDEKAQAAAFDGRLTLLERALGITSTAIPALDSKGSPLTIIPTLDNLQKQMSLLLETTPASLDAVGRRVRTLTTDAERLAEARRSAKLAADELRASSAESTSASIPAPVGECLEDPEHIAKINALYGTLSTIENLAPLLPSVLDRLKSLRIIHADAATVHGDIEEALRKQEEMGAELKRWREGLEKVEAVVNKSEQTMMGNVQAVEGWIKGLEAKVAKL